jgi:alpha-tubulin suppressor-like RCC1 family protein
MPFKVNGQVDVSNLLVPRSVFSSGGFWLWGYNNWGQLGDNTTTNRSSPVQTITSGNNWQTISIGYYTTAGIKTDGTLWLWGWNGLGLIGDNTTAHKSSPVQTIAGGTNWSSVACGYHTAALKTDGTIWNWGYNGQGQLGDTTIVPKSSPVQTVATGTNWKQVSCGYFSTSATSTV